MEATCWEPAPVSGLGQACSDAIGTVWRRGRASEGCLSISACNWTTKQLATHICVRSQDSMQSLQKRCMHADTARVFLMMPALLGPAGWHLAVRVLILPQTGNRPEHCLERVSSAIAGMQQRPGMQSVAGPTCRVGQHKQQAPLCSPMQMEHLQCSRTPSRSSVTLKLQHQSPTVKPGMLGSTMSKGSHEQHAGRQPRNTCQHPPGTWRRRSTRLRVSLHSSLALGRDGICRTQRLQSTMSEAGKRQLWPLKEHGREQHPS